MMTEIAQNGQRPLDFAPTDKSLKELSELVDVGSAEGSEELSDLLAAFGAAVSSPVGGIPCS